MGENDTANALLMNMEATGQDIQRPSAWKVHAPSSLSICCRSPVRGHRIKDDRVSGTGSASVGSMAELHRRAKRPLSRRKDDTIESAPSIPSFFFSFWRTVLFTLACSRWCKTESRDNRIRPHSPPINQGTSQREMNHYFPWWSPPKHQYR